MRNNISQNILNHIDDFIRKLSKKIDERPDKIKDFQDEMKSNLICSIQELISQGYHEKDAFNIAVSRFGDIDILNDELKHLYHVKSIFAKRLLNFTVIIGILGMLIFFGGSLWNNGISSVIASRKNLTLDTFISRNVGSVDSPVTDTIKQKLITEVEKNIYISAAAVQIRVVTVGTNRLNVEEYDYIYMYPSNTQTEKFKNVYYDSSIFTNNRPYYTIIKIPNSNKELLVCLLFTTVNRDLIPIGLGLLLLYWILFTVWSSLNVLYNKRSPFWIVTFAIFNVIGYCFYYAVYSHSRN